VAILGVITGDEIVEVGTFQGIGLQREVLIGPEVIDPECFRPRSLAGGFAVEEEDVGLDALGVKDTRGQAQKGVNVAFVEQLRRTVSPAPPSKRTLSGTTTEARP